MQTRQFDTQRCLPSCMAPINRTNANIGSYMMMLTYVLSATDKAPD